MKTHLTKVSTTAGFLEEAKVELHQGLTCIIGARGTCKSTLIESIRFAFETDPRRTATLIGEEIGEKREPTYGIIDKTLGAGSVRCELSREAPAGPSRMTLEREVGSAPRVFIDGVREHADHGVLHDIEIFSQGDLQRIAEEDKNDLRLALIDRPNKLRVAQLREMRDHHTEGLRKLGPELRRARARLSTLRSEIAQFEPARKQLAHISATAPAASPELEAERRLFEQREDTLRALRHLEEQRAQAATQLGDLSRLARWIRESINALRSGHSISLLQDIGPLENLLAASEEVLGLSERMTASSLTQFIEAAKRRFDSASDTYYGLRQQEQQVNESIKQQQALQRQVAALQEKETEAVEAHAAEAELLERRRNLRTQLQQIDDELYDLRVSEIDVINREHGDTVQLTLGSSWSIAVYSERLSDLLAGSRIRSQDEVAQSLAESLEPSALIDIVEAGDAQRLSGTVDRDLGQMTRVVAHLGDHPNFYDLETTLPTPRLDITLFQDGQPKPVETLSKGQRATALLPIILRPLPYPLLFDQPEDDLDNSFIFRSLIRTLRTLKHQRQLVFVTHNANIPVLGEADHVIVMSMSSPTSAAPPNVGTVDERKREILDLLEGGAEAFTKRESYYHDLLSHDVSQPGNS